MTGIVWGNQLEDRLSCLRSGRSSTLLYAWNATSRLEANLIKSEFEMVHADIDSVVKRLFSVWSPLTERRTIHSLALSPLKKRRYVLPDYGKLDNIRIHNGSLPLFHRCRLGILAMIFQEVGLL